MTCLLRITVLVSVVAPMFADGPLLEANRGQFLPNTRFVSRNGAISTAITKSGIEFRSEFPGQRRKIAIHLDRAALGHCEAFQPAAGQLHYLALSPPIRNVPSYSSVVCRDIYPGVDWVVHNSGDSLEHDWKIAPGADPRRIAMSLQAGAHAELTDAGDLLLRSGELAIVWKAPHSYQETGGTRQSVETHYVVKGHSISLAVGRRRRDAPLVIDPVIDYSYMISNNGMNLGCQVALDAAGNIYVAGLTAATNFETSSGAAFDAPGPAGTLQVFVRKLSPDGSRLIYSTFLGAGPASTVHPMGMRADPAGNVYLALFLGSSALAGGGLSIVPGGDIGVYKLAADGTRLVYGTKVLPFSDYNAPVVLAIDDAGNAYAAAGSSTIGVSKIDPSGNREIYSYRIPVSNYLGGLADVAVGADGSVYLAGNTSLGGLVTTPGALQSTITNPLGSHGYLMRMKADGSGPVYSTYIGGDFVDSLSALVVDGSGAAYIGGQTTGQGSDLALQGTSLGLTQPSSSSAFVMKVDPAGATALYTALLPYAKASAIALDPAGNLYASGKPNATAGIAIAKVDATGKKLLYFSTIPGPPTPAGFDIPLGIAIDASGAAYVTGAVGGLHVPNDASSSILLNSAFVLRMNPNPDQCDLWVEAKANGSVFQDFSIPVLFTIHNNGPASAENVIFLAGMTGAPFSAACRVSATGVCGTRPDAPWASFPAIPAGESQSVELNIGTAPPAGVTASASVSTLTSDVHQDNNTDGISMPDYVPVQVGANLPATYTFIGSGAQAGAVPGLSGISCAAPNSQFQIYWPSPQVVQFYGPVIFKNWYDGSTDNPRSGIATAPELSLKASFELLGTPSFTPGSVVNAGNYASGGVSPGELVSVYGFNLGQAASAQLQNGRLPFTLGGTTVTFDKFPAPLIYVGTTQINAVVPYEIAGQSTTKIDITVEPYTGVYSMTVPVVPAVPALFTADASGSDQAAALNQDGTPNSPGNPANPGDAIVLYGTGEGLVSPMPVDGSISQSPTSHPNLPVSVVIGGQPASVLYSGAAPGLAAGVIQINARIPAGIEYSHHVAVSWSAGNVSSQPGATIAINDSPKPAFVYQPGADDLSLTTTSLSPARIAADSGGASVVISGSGFVQGMVAQWNNQARKTIFLDPNRLQVSLTGNDLESPGLGGVSVWDQDQTHQITKSMPLLVYLPVLNNDLAYDAPRGKVYIAVARGQVPQGPAIAVLSPESGRIERWYALDGEPTKLTLSGDGRYLYAALGNLVRRIDLATWKADLDIPLGQDVSEGAREVLSMVTLPGANSSLAVSFTKTGVSPPYLGTAVFDGAQIRPMAIRSGPGYLIGGPDDSTLYGVDFSGIGGGLDTLHLDSTGVTLLDTAAGLISGDGDPVYAGGLIYDGSGSAIDPKAQKIVQSWDNSGLIVPVPDLKRVLILGGSPPPWLSPPALSSVLTLSDTVTGVRLWSLRLPVTVSGHGPMFHWGTNGVVFRESQNYHGQPPGVVIFRVNLGQ